MFVVTHVRARHVKYIFIHKKNYAKRSIFCAIVLLLRANGLPVSGVFIGTTTDDDEISAAQNATNNGRHHHRPRVVVYKLRNIAEKKYKIFRSYLLRIITWINNTLILYNNTAYVCCNNIID